LQKRGPFYSTFLVVGGNKKFYLVVDLIK